MSDLNLNVGANTSNAQASVGQLATLTEAQMKRIASFVKAASDEQRKFSASIKDAANSSSYKVMAEGAEKVRAGHAGVNRELLVLTHELSQGNFSRFGGSMLVLAERTNALEFAMTGAGAATLGIAGALIGSIALMASGAIEADKFAKALQLTGNYAAITQEQIKGLAQAQSAQTGQSVGASRSSLEAVAGSGLFGPAEVAVAARALGDYQKLTGETAADALKKFASIQDGVAKWAETENKSVHFLTAAEYDHIKALEDSGDKEGAAVEALKAYAQTIESRGQPALGLLARAWHAVADGASRAGQAIMDVGRPTETLTASLNAIDKQIALVKQANTANPAGAADLLANLGEARRQVLQEQFQQGERRSAAATKAASDVAAIAASRDIEGWEKRAKAANSYADEVAKRKAAFAAEAKDGNPVSPERQAAILADLKKEYTNHGAAAQETEYRNLSATIQAFNGQTDLQISMQRKLTDAEQFGIRIREDLAKAGAKLNDQERTSIRLQADAAASRRAQAEIDAKVHPVNSPESDFRTSELAGTGAVNEAVRQAQLAEDAIRHTKIAQQEFNSEASNGYVKASRVFVQQANDNAAQAEQFFNDSVNGMSKALEDFAMTGKFSFKGLIDSLISDLIRFQTQKAIAGLVNGDYSYGGGNSPLKLLGGLGGGTSDGVKMGSFADLFSGSSFGGSAFAGGIDDVPYNGMPAVLHQGERVMTRIENQRSKDNGGTVQIDMSGAHYSFGAGVDAGTMAQYVRTSQAQTKADVMRALSTNGRLAA